MWDTQEVEFSYLGMGMSNFKKILLSFTWIQKLFIEQYSSLWATTSYYLIIHIKISLGPSTHGKRLYPVYWVVFLGLRTPSLGRLSLEPMTFKAPSLELSPRMLPLWRDSRESQLVHHPLFETVPSLGLKYSIMPLLTTYLEVLKLCFKVLITSMFQS